MAKAKATKPLDLTPRWQRQESTYTVGRAAIDGVDALAIECEKRWGVGRLRLLVDDDLRSRFDSQRLKLRHAINGGELIDVQREASRMTTAWRTLDSRAKAEGAVPLSPVVWEVALPSGKVAALVRSVEEARSVAAAGRHVDVYTLDEIANLLDGFPLLAKVKETFPGAEVVRIKPIRDPLEDWDEEEGDDVAFPAPA